ncbi:uncharacterized protein N7483_009178 [Penicillium malachiteum]|uniref:uncharacterized protein n=1 Tax=Penicillium malachiteum TaxID=1324776 RepID=UPI002548AEED|nr:uncharacterized protein N7483_009178 [Penicillium malachiteum]KAJ5721244.1 hypothetical protein N7483_009178 [Penicillium malachiteum]
MDQNQVNSQDNQPKPNPQPLKLDSIESYQRHWAQLMDDTNRQLQRIQDAEQARLDKLYASQNKNSESESSNR